MDNATILPTVIYPQSSGYVSTLTPTVSGTGAPGATISGTLNNITFTASVSANGLWSYTVQTPLTDKTSYTLRLLQTEQNGTTSPPITVRFNSDTTLLTHHKVTYPLQKQAVNTNSPIVTGFGKPGAVIEVKLGDQLSTAAVGPDGMWQVGMKDLPEGTVSLHIDQKDMGNTSPGLVLEFIVDTVSPTEPSVIEPPDNGYTKNPMPVVKGRGEADALVTAIVDDRKYATQVSPQGDWQFEISETLVDETHIISAKQTDRAGNISPEYVSLFNVKANQPPPPCVDNLVSGAIIREASPWFIGHGEQNCTIEAHVGDKVYSARVEDDGRWHLDAPLALPEGQNTILFYQLDPAGNISGALNLTLVVDTKAPPPPVVIYPEKNAYVNTPGFTVKGTGEPDGSIECELGGTTYQTRVFPNGCWQIGIGGKDSLMYSMEYSLSVRQIDQAGNVSPATRVEFRLDQHGLSAPELTYPADQASINTMPVFKGTGKAGATINLNIQSDYYTAAVEANGTWTIDIGKALCQGEYTVNISQTEFGNTSPARTSKFTIDMAVPQPPIILAPTENQTFCGPVVISGDGQNGADVTVLLDDKTYSAKVKDGSWTLAPLESLTNGIHSILASQSTSAGNTSGCVSVSFSYFAEDAGPVTPPSGPLTYELTYNPDGPAWTTATIVMLKTSLPITVYGINGTVFSAVVRQNGLHSFDYSYLDGCSGTVTAGVTWIDDTPPVLSIQPSGNYFSSDKTVTYYTNGGSAIRAALLNGMPFESGRQVTEEGLYQVEVRDMAGNSSARQFVIDRTPPLITGAENQKVYTADVTLKITDTLSGIKSAILNGRNILSCTRVTENGDYTLKVTDYGENTAELSFSIQK